MSRYRKPLIGSVIFTVFALVVTWMVFGTLVRGVAGPTNTYSAIFTDVSGLADGDDVRVAGVRVGRVDKIELVDALAKVTFRVQRAQTLYTNTIASVTYQNIIGQRYLGLAQGAGGNRQPLPNHSQIPKERTNPSFDISHALNGFEPLLEQLEPEQVDNLTNAITRAFGGDTTSILAVTTQASALAETFAGPDEVLGDLIGNLDALMASLASQNTNLQTMIQQTRGVMADLAGRREELVDSVGSINSTVSRLAAIVNNITPDAQQLVSRQPGVLDYGLHDGRARLAYLTANVPGLMKAIARTMQDGSYINGYACDVDFGLWHDLYYWFRGIVAAATRGNGHEVWHSPVCR
ncbi:MlaD family protein [Mycobacterium talmoniae]|uniref:Mammalian cell entry protein n=1 Tax=Mycobacterium talmoniae TaxID=1858794 RepID=A0A1S1NQF6_9MYCO|nr:MCE family protein [Mycobacterium talmoniae]OHV05069.1 mammalian cell entry protein [Mycobacterium talmoniae]